MDCGVSMCMCEHDSRAIAYVCVRVCACVVGGLGFG